MMVAAATPYAAHAEEPIAPAATVARLVRRALVRAGLDGELGLERREQRSLLWPKLRVGASLRRPEAPAGAALWEVWALAAWPLDRRLGTDGRAGAVRAERRAEIADRVASLWRARERLRATLTDGETLDRLKADEVDAELAALTGDAADGEEDAR